MAKCTKTQAKRLVEDIHKKCNRLMANNYITTKQFVSALGCVESMRKTIDKK